MSEENASSEQSEPQGAPVRATSTSRFSSARFGGGTIGLVRRPPPTSSPVDIPPSRTSLFDEELTSPKSAETTETLPVASLTEELHADEHTASPSHLASARSGGVETLGMIRRPPPPPSTDTESGSTLFADSVTVSSATAVDEQSTSTVSRSSTRFSGGLLGALRRPTPAPAAAPPVDNSIIDFSTFDSATTLTVHSPGGSLNARDSSETPEVEAALTSANQEATDADAASATGASPPVKPPKLGAKLRAAASKLMFAPTTTLVGRSQTLADLRRPLSKTQPVSLSDSPPTTDNTHVSTTSAGATSPHHHQQQQETAKPRFFSEQRSVAKQSSDEAGAAGPASEQKSVNTTGKVSTRTPTAAAAAAIASLGAKQKLSTKITAWEHSSGTESQPVIRRKIIDVREGIPNKLRRSFAMFDVARDGHLSLDEVDRAFALLTRAGLDVDQTATVRLKLDITMQPSTQGMRFSDYITYFADEEKLRSLDSLVGDTATETLTSQVQEISFNWLVTFRIIVLYLFLPLSYLLAFSLRSPIFLPFLPHRVTRGRCVRHLIYYLVAVAVPLLCLLSEGGSPLSNYEMGGGLLFYLSMILHDASTAATLLRGSEVASRIQKTVLDRTLIKLPYDEDCNSAGRVLELLLERYVEERRSVKRFLVYTYSHSSELYVMCGLALLHVLLAPAERVFVDHVNLFGTTWFHTFTVLCNLSSTFVGCSMLLSHMNHSKLRLSAKLLRFQLFDALTDINQAVEKRLPFITLQNVRNVEGWWRIRTYLQHGRSEDAKAVRRVEAVLANVTFVDVTFISVLLSGFVFMHRNIGLWVMLPLYDAVLLTTLLMWTISVGVRISSMEQAHAQQLIETQLEHSLSALNRADDEFAAGVRKCDELLERLVETIQECDQPMHILMFDVNGELLNTLAGYVGTLLITLLSFMLSSFLPSE